MYNNEWEIKECSYKKNPDYVIRIFHLHNLSGRTMALELT